MLKQLEADSIKDKCTQIFIETPYRNNQLVDAILKECRPESRLCIAVDITGANESIKTLKLRDWQKVDRALNLLKPSWHVEVVELDVLGSFLPVGDDWFAFFPGCALGAELAERLIRKLHDEVPLKQGSMRERPPQKLPKSFSEGQAREDVKTSEVSRERISIK